MALFYLSNYNLIIIIIRSDDKKLQQIKNQKKRETEPSKEKTEPTYISHCTSINKNLHRKYRFLKSYYFFITFT